MTAADLQDYTYSAAYGYRPFIARLSLPIGSDSRNRGIDVSVTMEKFVLGPAEG